MVVLRTEIEDSHNTLPFEGISFKNTNQFKVQANQALCRLLPSKFFRRKINIY